MPPLSDHSKGFLLTVAGVLALCPDTLLIRLIDVDPWSIAFWRGGLTALGLALAIALLPGHRILGDFRAMGRSGLLVALMYALNAILFVNALAYTSVANTLFILSSAPLFAALFSWAFLGERTSARTWIAIGCVSFGIAVIVSDSLGPRGLWGDLIALATAASVAATFTAIRHARRVSMLPALAFGSVVSALIALGFGASVAVAAQSIPFLILLGIFLPLALGLIAIGPRYLPAAEVGLLMLLEAVLGPLLVWAVLGEATGPRGLLGGAIVIGTLTVHSIIGLRRSSRAVPIDGSAA